MNDKLIILLSTYNGEKYLRQQLDSIFNQSYSNFQLLVRDDGSSDLTVPILEDYASNHNNMSFYIGPNLKSAHSFWDLLQKAPEASYYAFADQDDVWLPEKMSSAIQCMKEYNSNLYYSNYQMVDENLNILNTPSKIVVDTIGKAMVLTTATGCTMVISKRLRDVAVKYTPDFMVMHDSHLLKIALSVCPPVYFDNRSYILYRQHAMNVLGGRGAGFKEKWKRRYARVVNSDRIKWKEINDIYNGYSTLMDENSRIIVEQLVHYLGKNLWMRIKIALNPAYRIGIFASDLLFKMSIIIKSY